ncbi:glutamate racemase [bacterium]|nr:glutamate racemase [bacterium]
MIGVFDSGLGGLSVAAKIMEAYPKEQIVYFADNAHVPYGERPLDEIRGFALDITAHLITKGAKTVVMACNMSSAVALEASQNRFPDVPILGVIEPGAKAAIGVAGEAPIGVLATSGTVKSGAYEKSIHKLDSQKKVIQQACPEFVPLVESGRADSEEAEAAARDYVAPLIGEGCRTIILGCTHYPFLRRAIESAAGRDIIIVDPAVETTQTLGKILVEQGMAAYRLDAPHVFSASGDTAGFAALGSIFLGRTIDKVEKITIAHAVETAVKIE